MIYKALVIGHDSYKGLMVEIFGQVYWGHGPFRKTDSYVIVKLISESQRKIEFIKDLK